MFYQKFIATLTIALSMQIPLKAYSTTELLGSSQNSIEKYHDLLIYLREKNATLPSSQLSQTILNLRNEWSEEWNQSPALTAMINELSAVLLNNETPTQQFSSLIDLENAIAHNQKTIEKSPQFKNIICGLIVFSILSVIASVGLTPTIVFNCLDSTRKPHCNYSIAGITATGAATLLGVAYAIYLNLKMEKAFENRERLAIKKDSIIAQWTEIQLPYLRELLELFCQRNSADQPYEILVEGRGIPDAANIELGSMPPLEPI